MQTTRSASWAPRLWRSASETASTVSMPSSKQALIRRTAISPRLAMRTRRSLSIARSGLRVHDDDRLPELHGRAVLDGNLGDDAVDRRDDVVHELHDLDDRQGVAGRD